VRQLSRSGKQAKTCWAVCRYARSAASIDQRNQRDFPVLAIANLSFWEQDGIAPQQGMNHRSKLTGQG
jgi:hypothetical protein